MRPTWEITVPARGLRLPGVTMAGFSDRANELADVELVPHPAHTLLFDLGEQPLTLADGDGHRWRGHVAAGLAPRGARGSGLAGGFACLQVRLSPLLALPVPDGQVVGLDELWGRDAERVGERLRAAPTWEDRFAIAETAVLHRLGAGRPVDPEVAHCWRRLLAGHGRLRVDRLADEVGWSRKRLWSRFRAQVGLSPKRAAQLVRFDHAAHRLAAGHGAAAVAADGGYVDQSHLHRDVMTFTGVTPGAVATSPFLAVDDVAWPGPPLSRRRATSSSSACPRWR